MGAGLATAQDLVARRDWLLELAPLVSERIKRLDEVVPMVAFLFSEDVEIDPAAFDKALRAAGIDAALLAAAEALENVGDFRHDAIEAALRSVPEAVGLKPKAVFQAVRVAVTGSTVSPPLFESLELLGRDRALRRIRAALEAVRAA